MLSDSKYIRYYAELNKYDAAQDKRIGKHVLLHKCTKEDFKRFYPPKSQEIADKTKRLQEDGDIFCLDWKALDFGLSGNWDKPGDYSWVNIKLIPCAVQI